MPDPERERPELFAAPRGGTTRKNNYMNPNFKVPLAGDGSALSKRGTMTVAALLEETRPIVPLLENLYRAKTFFWEVEGGYVWLHGNSQGLDATTQNWLSQQPQETTIFARLWTLSAFVGEGPKVFRPTSGEAEALEHVDVGVTFAEYRQPFSVMAVELPRDYQRTKIVPVVIARTGQHIADEPSCVLIRHDPDYHVINLTVVFCSGLHLELMLTPGTVDDPWNTPIEHALQGSSKRNVTTPATNDEDALLLPGDATIVGYQAARIAINAMLLLTEYGTKQRSPDNPSHAARLSRHLDNARRGKGKGDVEEAERRLRLVPQVYGILKQDIILIEHEQTAEHVTDSPSSGETTRPHWRRGHWRKQRHGPQLTLTKRIFINPVLVNAVHFLGRPSQTTVVYRRKK